VLEDVNDADGGIGALDAGLDQREIPGVAEPELVSRSVSARQTSPEVGRLAG
jgi:hypothetical protein